MDKQEKQQMKFEDIMDRIEKFDPEIRQTWQKTLDNDIAEHDISQYVKDIAGFHEFKGLKPSQLLEDSRDIHSISYFYIKNGQSIFNENIKNNLTKENISEQFNFKIDRKFEIPVPEPDSSNLSPNKKLNEKRQSRRIGIPRSISEIPTDI